MNGPSIASPEVRRPGSTGKKLPPFGRRLLSLRRAGRVPDTRQVVIAVADWTLVKHTREDMVVIPQGEPVEFFDFRFVAGLPCLLIVNEHDIEIADQVADQVIAARCKGCVALVMPAFSGKIGFRKYMSHFPGKPHVD